jgi:hypothetical protein
VKSDGFSRAQAVRQMRLVKGMRAAPGGKIGPAQQLVAARADTRFTGCCS